MAEIDLRPNYFVSPGLPRHIDQISLDVYRLMTIFGSSRELAGRRGDDDHEVTVYGFSTRQFEYNEIGRILISCAAQLRNEWDGKESRFDPVSKVAIGALTEDLTVGTASDLGLRESFNKIIHANTLNLERSDATNLFSGHLEPRVHLYGTKAKRQWKATIEIFPWCEAVHVVA